jgi:hypothetical protein
MLLWIFVKGAPPAPPRLRRARGALLAERCVARAGAVGILDEHNKAQVRRAAPGRGASGGAEAGAWRRGRDGGGRGQVVDHICDDLNIPLVPERAKQVRAPPRVQHGARSSVHNTRLGVSDTRLDVSDTRSAPPPPPQYVVEKLVGYIGEVFEESIVLSYQRRISEGHDHARARLRAARASPEWAEIERAHPWRGVLGFFWRINCLWKDRTPDSIAALGCPAPAPGARRAQAQRLRRARGGGRRRVGCRGSRRVPSSTAPGASSSPSRSTSAPPPAARRPPHAARRTPHAARRGGPLARARSWHGARCRRAPALRDAGA